MFITTMYSSKSALRIDPAIKKIKEMGVKSVAMVDDTFGSVPRFVKACRANGVKPIIGLKMKIEGVDANILCKNEKGYSFVSRKFLGGLSMEDLNNENIIVIFNGYETEGDIDRAMHQVPNAYVGIFEDKDEEVMKRMGYMWGTSEEERRIPFFVANHVEPEEEEALRILEAGSSDKKLMEIPAGKNRGRHIKPFLDTPTLSGPSLKEVYPYLEQNYQKVMNACVDDFDSFGRGRAPSYPFVDKDIERGIEEGKSGFKKGMSESALFKVEVIHGFKKRLQKVPKQRWGEYTDRLKMELSIIEKMGFEGYLLIVNDFVRKAREAGIPIGPGRGSSAGSLIAFSLEIVDIDPMEYGLLFERFLNPERFTMPDIDVDVPKKHRQFVLDMIRNDYGLDNVAQIPSFNTFKAKVAIEEAARVLGFPVRVKERISKVIGEELKNLTLDEIYEKIPREIDDILYVLGAENVWEIAKKIEGLVKYLGLHASGIIISPTPIYEKSPLMDVNGARTIHVEGDDAEWFELIKFDLLGLRILSVIEKASELIEERHGKKIEMNKIDRNDPSVYKFFSEGSLEGVFQFSSKGMRDLAKKIPPKNFNDIIDIIALYRPGVLGSSLLESYINRKNEKEKVTYLSEEFREVLTPILKQTQGIIVYQEQVMQIVGVVGNFTLGKADLVRRAMSKKSKDSLHEMKKAFLQGATDKGYTLKGSEELFTMIEKFAGYGFNKSHSAAYALLSYYTAAIKNSYEIEFLTASLSLADDDDKIRGFVEDAMKNGIEILPPDINKSQASFTIEDDNRIRFGLSSIKGIGEATAEKIVLAREGNFIKEELVDSLFGETPEESERRDFSSLEDLKSRMGKALKEGIIKSLLRSGALSSVEQDINGLMRELDPKEDVSGLTGSVMDKMALEKKVFGFSITDPFSKSKEMLSKYEIPSFDNIPIKKTSREKVSPAFIPVIPIEITAKTTKKGKPMVKIVIMSGFQTEEIFLFNEKQINELEEILGRDDKGSLIQKPIILALSKKLSDDGSGKAWPEIEYVDKLKNGKKEWGPGIFPFKEGVLKVFSKKEISSSLNEKKELSNSEQIDLSEWEDPAGKGP